MRVSQHVLMSKNVSQQNAPQRRFGPRNIQGISHGWGPDTSWHFQHSRRSVAHRQPQILSPHPKDFKIHNQPGQNRKYECVKQFGYQRCFFRIALQTSLIWDITFGHRWSPKKLLEGLEDLVPSLHLLGGSPSELINRCLCKGDAQKLRHARQLIAWNDTDCSTAEWRLHTNLCQTI